MNDSVANQLRKTCWNEALECYGTGYIFEDRSRAIRPRIRALSLLGIGVPAFVGGIVLTLGSQGWYVTVIRVIGSVLLLAELALSVWAVIMRWEERLYYSLDSAASNYRFADEFKALAENPPTNEEKFKCEVQKLRRGSEERQRIDYRQGVSDTEKRKGMRAALRYFERECAACGEVPTSMEPSNCDVCGDFSPRTGFLRIA